MTKGGRVAAGLFFIIGFLCFVGATFIVMNRESSGASEALKKAESVNERIDKLDKSLGDLNRILTNDMTALRGFCGGLNEKATKTQAKVEWMEMKLNNKKPDVKFPLEVTIISTPGSRRATLQEKIPHPKSRQ
jgi:hypothetical protein